MNENMGEQVNKGKEETPSSTHTKETLQALADLGYPKDSRNQLTPEEVSKILEKQISYKKEISLPKTGEDHDARELERLQEAWQKAFDEMLDNAPKNEYGDVLENTNRTREEAEKYLKDNKNTLSAESIIFISTSIMVKKKKEEEEYFKEVYLMNNVQMLIEASLDFF